MTSPTDLAERLREIARRYKLYPGAEFEQDAQDLREAAKVLSALESAASGAVTDAEIAEVIRALRIARVCGHPGCHDECGGLQPPIMAVAADLLERLGPRLAKGAMCERVLYGTEKYLTDKEGHIALRLYAALGRLAKAEQRCKLLESENSRCASILDDALSFCLLSPNEPASQALRDRILLSRTLAPSSEPAPSDGAYGDPLFHEPWCYVHVQGGECICSPSERLQRMAMDDAKKGHS